MSYVLRVAATAGLVMSSLLGSASLHAQTAPPQANLQANIQLQNAAKQQIESIKATPAQVAAFKANPASLISTNRNGGQSLVALVQALVLADPDLATTIANVAGAANVPDALASNIGEGLGKAAVMLNAAGDAQAAGKVQTAVASASAAKPAVQNGYSSGSNTTTTLSVGPGGAPIGGGTPIGSGAPVGGGAAPVAGGGVGIVGFGSGSSSGGGNTTSQPSSSSFRNQATTFAGLTNGSAASVSPR